MHRFSTIAAFIFFVFAALAARAEEITFKADAMTGIAGSKTSRTVLSGNAFVKTSSMEISADSIELDGDDFRFITATGAVVGKNTKTQMDFTCGKMSYDRETEVARLEDSVHLVDNENAVTTDAQLIEYNQDSEIAIMQIGVTLKQKDNTCTSAYAVYRKKAQLLEMSGNPKIVQGEDTFRAQEITLNLDTQEITLDGRVSGTVTDSKKTDEPKSADAQDESTAENATAPAADTATDAEAGAKDGSAPASDGNADTAAQAAGGETNGTAQSADGNGDGTATGADGAATAADGATGDSAADTETKAASGDSGKSKKWWGKKR